MKIIPFFLAMFLSMNAYADLGGCLVYKAKYVLKDGRTIIGLLPLLSYEDYSYLDDKTRTNRYCSDVEFQKLINNVFYAQRKTINFTIYKEIHLINFGKSASQKDCAYPIRCAFADSNSVIQLNLDSIKYTVFLSVKNADWQYVETSIQLFDNKTCQMLIKNESVNHAFLTHPPELEHPESIYYYYFDTYFVINFNKDISLHELNNEIKAMSKPLYEPEINYKNSIMKGQTQIFDHEKSHVVYSLIKNLRKKGIIMYRVQQTC